MRHFALAVALTITTVVLAAVPMKGSAQAQSGAAPTSLPDMALGSPDAPITVIEYASASCVACADFHVKVFPRLRQRYIDTGKVRFIFREFAFDEEAAAISMLARCQGPERYFDFMALAFKRLASNWRKYSKSPPLAWIKAVGLEAGMSEDAVIQCLKDEKLLAGLETLRQGAFDLGVRSVPAVFVNGTQVAIPRGRQLNFADIERAIRNAR